MKLKKAFLFMALICQMAYGMKDLNTPDERMERWMQLQREIADLNERLPAVQQAYDALPGKSKIPETMEIPQKIQKRIDKKSEEAEGIVRRAAVYQDKWLDNRQDLLLGFLSRTVAVIRRAVTPSVSAPTILPEREWGGAGDPPPLPPAPSTSFLTPKRKKYAIGAAIVIALGTLYKKAPQWMKNRVKRILAEHGKTLADVTPAEQDLLISASYDRFHPAGSFFFQEAVLDMPEGQTFREELWPVLYHVYYGKKKVGRKRRAELRKLYHEAQEMV